jgi:transposase
MNPSITSLAEAHNNQPHADFAALIRVSGRGKKWAARQAAQERAVKDEVEKLTGRKVKKVFPCVEPGKVSARRETLRAAAQYAKRYGCVLVAWDVSRFVRAEAYDHRTNRNAEPTEADFAKLVELTLGVVLAVVVDPALTESGRHSRRIRRGGKAGRKRKVDDKVLAAIVAAAGLYYRRYTQRNGKAVYRFLGGRTYAVLAKRFNVSKSTIHRVLSRKAPDGLTWLKKLRSQCNHRIFEEEQERLRWEREQEARENDERAATHAGYDDLDAYRHDLQELLDDSVEVAEARQMLRERPRCDCYSDECPQFEVWKSDPDNGWKGFMAGLRCGRCGRSQWTAKDSNDKPPRAAW